MPNIIFEAIMPQLPCLLTRKDISRHFGTLISPRYLANLDSKGHGPRKLKIGNKVAYRKEDFVEWLSDRMN